MGKNTINTKRGRLVVVSLLVLLLITSAAQAFVFSEKNINSIVQEESSPPQPLLGENYYTWEDVFNDATKVDPTMSYNYEISGGAAKMQNTYSLWTDPAWTRMKQITITELFDDHTTHEHYA